MKQYFEDLATRTLEKEGTKKYLVSVYLISMCMAVAIFTLCHMIGYTIGSSKQLEKSEEDMIKEEN